VNARLTYETPDERWQVSVYGRNLFDDKYNAFMEDALAAFGVALIWPAAPQEFGATVKFNF
jgi:outer membrane receptor protein involved in Fe transport